MDRFPTAGFELTKWQPLHKAGRGTPKGVAAGLLTIKNTSRRIHLPVDIGPEGNENLKAHAAFDIDRTLWIANYGSGKLYERLGMHLVYDHVSIELFITAIRQ